MSIQQNPATRPSFAVPANLNRLLLHCRFDLRQKTWGLPAWENRRDCDFIFPTNSAVLTSAGGKSLKTSIRHFLRGSPMNPPMDQTKVKLLFLLLVSISNQRSRDAGGGTSPPPVFQNLQLFLKHENTNQRQVGPRHSQYRHRARRRAAFQCCQNV